MASPALPPGFTLLDDLPSDTGSGPLVVTVRPNRQKPVASDAPALPEGFSLIEDAPADMPAPSSRPVEGFAIPQGKTGNEPSRLRSGLMGLAQGATFNFADEIASGVNAGVDYVTGQAPNGIADAYARRAKDIRSQFAAAEKENPGTFLAGQIGGGIATIPFTPVKAGVAGGALTGAAYGALSGAGAGEGIGGTITGAGTGAAVGGAVGAAVPALIGGAKALYGKAREAAGGATGIVRGAVSPESEAARRVQAALARDASLGGNQLDDAAVTAAQNAGQPVRVADMGGETTRALARSAANTSPEGRQILQDVTSDRFSSQNPRAVEFVQKLVGTSGDAGATRESLQAAARVANRAAYGKAYAQGAANVWDDTLAQLAQAPAVQAEIRDATRRSANKAASQGFKPASNPFLVNEAGDIVMKPGVSPSLQFWDVVKQGLDDQVDALTRKGAKGEANDIRALRDGLRNHLDALVPSYGAARKGAAAAFDAEDALEAGQKFVSSNMANNDARRAFAKMSEPERRLFAEGFASDLIEKINRTGDRQNVIKQIWGTPRARERIEIALGKNKAKEFEAFVNIETTMDMLRNAVQGNSTTARQLAEIGLAGGGAAFSYNGDPETGMKMLMIAALSRGQRAVDARVAQKVAEMLVSDNPDMVRKAAAAAARNPTLLQSIKSANDYLTKAISPAVNENVARPLEVTVRPFFQGSRSALGGEGQDEGGNNR